MGRIREQRYDIAKALAIYLVVYGHLLNSMADDPTILITFCHMPLFFYISGYFFQRSTLRYSLLKCINRRIKSLLLPYLIWSGVSWIANACMIYLKGNGSISAVVCEFIDIFGLARSVWFLIELFIVMVLFLILKSFGEKIKCNLMITEICGWLILSVFVPGKWFAFYKFKWLFPFFLLGYFISQKPEVVKNIYSKGYCYIGLLFFVLAKLFYVEEYFEEYITFDYGSIKGILFGVVYYMVSGLGVSLILFCAEKIKIKKWGNIFADFGRYSMDIYVLHMFLVKFISFSPLSFRKKMYVFKYIWLPLYAGIIVIIIYFGVKKVLSKSKLYNISVGKI